LYPEEIRHEAKKRARERIRKKEPEWTIKYDCIPPKAGRKITESDNVLYRQEIRRCLRI